MSNDFPKFGNLVATSFQNATKSGMVFVTNVNPDDLYAHYLMSFPEGTNPLFKQRTEHDCSCCKQFIRRCGAVVTIDDKDRIHTIWGKAAHDAPYPYNIVAAAMREMVLGAEISDLFRVGEKEPSFGAEKSHSQDKDTGRVLTWNHFHTGSISKDLRVSSPDQVRGDYRTTVQVFRRGLTELTPESVETVLSLVETNNLYRGEEFKKGLLDFQSVQKKFLDKTDKEREVFAWANAMGPATRIRNTAIGTLLQDLSEGKDIEAAVKSYEVKVAPTNYKRPTSIITPRMVEAAMKTLGELGLEEALERRLAVIGDINVNDVLWVDGRAKSLMKGGLGDLLMQHAQALNPKANEGEVARAEEITLDDFLGLFPEIANMELLFKGSQVGNLVSLTAPMHSEPKQLFKWDNDFAWSYNGNTADSYLRQQVQSLGGRVDGVLRFSHMWNHERRNASLMDLHVFMPGSTEHRDGYHNTYPKGQRVGWNNRKDALSGGIQDVDYTEAAPEGYVPVENITFPDLGRLKDGPYTFKIHNWQLREPTQGGFRAEIEFGGQVFQYDHPAPLKHHEWITLAIARLKDGVFTIEHKHPVGTAVQQLWGLTTEQFVKVNAVTYSPNYWGENRVGNRHVFLFLEGCSSDQPARGIYNEFLHPRLDQHRKVMEIVADKTKCRPVAGSLSGVGFSSTKKDSFIVRVQQGKKRRVLNVKIAT